MRAATLGIIGLCGILLLSACTAAEEHEEPTAAPGLSVADDGTLSEVVDITIAMPVKAGATLGPIMAQHWGEFDKRNLRVSIEVIPTSDATALVSTGRADVLHGGLSAGMMNIIDSGADLRLVMPGNTRATSSGTGYYASASVLAGQEFQPAILKGKKVASTQGNSGVSMLELKRILDSAHLSITDVEVVTMSNQDQIIALENGAIFAGWLTEPQNIAVLDAGTAVRIPERLDEGRPSTVIAFGPTLLKDKPEAGMAFAAAMKATYARLQGDYLRDPKILKDIAAALEQPEESLAQSTSEDYSTMLFPARYVEDLQKVWFDFADLLQYDPAKPLASGDVIDTRFVDWATSR